MATSEADFLRWARSALVQYPLDAANLTFLGHSDNITFRVGDRQGMQYLLRLHDPVIPYYLGMRQLPEAIASELAWMEALLRQGGIHLQQPVPSTAGDPLVQITIEQGRRLPCTLLTWLDGAHFSPAAGDGPEQVERLGALVAQMHEFSSRWSPPPGLVRPSYDLEHFRRIFARLLHGVDLGVFSEEMFWTLRSTARKIMDEIGQLSFDSEAWGMIHADLHVGNFLINGQEIIPIDFSFCGFGHYLYDLSVCLAGGLTPHLRQAFFRGYRGVRSLPESCFRAVEAYALVGKVSYYAYQIDNPAERKWLQAHIPLVVENECKRYLRGEGMLGLEGS
jgi:Ser/Thr protein kinase RdoA (MazF antagonist)